MEHLPKCTTVCHQKVQCAQLGIKHLPKCTTVCHQIVQCAQLGMKHLPKCTTVCHQIVQCAQLGMKHWPSAQRLPTPIIRWLRREHRHSLWMITSMKHIGSSMINYNIRSMDKTDGTRMPLWEIFSPRWWYFPSNLLYQSPFMVTTANPNHTLTEEGTQTLLMYDYIHEANR